MSTISYIKNFIKDRDVAAITPSSTFLVKRVCRWIDFSRPNVIIEYGPGTGVFTEHLVAEMTNDSRLILIEGNDAFVEELSERFGHDERVDVYHDRAENVEQVLQAAGEEAADYVISGIPFSFLDDDVKHELIQRTRKILTDTGKFLVYQNYNHMEKPLRHHFGHVHKEYELLNIPPMYAYQAAK
jgi:phospholipid N-methyltransferase